VGVSLRLPASSFVATSDVAWRGEQAWFGVAVDRELRIYRWQKVAWVLDGTVDLPYGMSPPGAGGGELSSTGVTAGIAPDFTSRAWGADTLWFALAARRGSRWRVVPFDDQFGRRHPYTFAYGASHGLIHGVFDACGCAGGPTTDQWYRYARGVFVPTNPPGQPAVCSATALASAGHWPRIPEDPLVRDVTRPFRAVRFACANGWALATDGHNVSVYEQHGPRLNDPLGRRWLRVGVGSPRLVGTRTEFALPRSLLNRLAHRIGVSMPPAPRDMNGPPLRPRTRWQIAPITVRVGPGDSYSATDLFDGRPKVLTLTISSRSRVTTVTRFRWRNGGWVRLSARR
jgi:hypothetical protein